MDYGILYVFMFVVVPNGERPRQKKVNLCNFYCTKDEVHAKLGAFGKLNPDLQRIDATWVYTHHIQMGSL
jgi:hypothetical protein